MSERTVLISGAGVGGPTAAYWLARHGFRVTVVERAQGLRSSGNPVDVRGSAVDVAERMGLLSRLREAATGTTGLSFVNASGRRIGRMDMRAVQQADEVELPRGDLASILYEASRDHAEFLFEDSIASLDQDEHGVEVTFDRTDPRRFDLVIGADGLHSTTRRLAFGAESGLARHMGLYVATTPLGGRTGPGRDILMHNTPGKAVAVSPTPSGDLAFFLYRSPAEPGFDYRDTEQHKRLLTSAFADVSWRVPDLLEHVRTAEDLYFDSVSQVRLPRWWNGRVALLGDAASCVSLFGDGSTLAMTGAFTLAEELASSPDDPQAAFRRYETTHRRLVEPKQRNVGQAAALLVPATRLGILARNLATHLWPAVAVATRLRHTLSRTPAVS
ncbi:FAD-dependent monooxygenase [Streptosporangium sp. NBC_01756]|uniref:FAD-dependent monooxygenase n=1 Tax=Streptosporangium sp. NBC_01756 TaxID=2975950 RepID=UPI002DDAEF9A|nr:FAD-dependent monooxygenase [Streptosporangium sp. NBC_01756]WSC83397.1 FAD-dependent monooxygenase [Streptosporangium sp. NBC_01756]